MVRFTLLLFVALLGAAGRLAAQESVEMRGITSAVKLEEVVFGHLTELNGKYKMRATEVTFAPGGYLGVHHHVGPGIRYVLSGEVTFTEGGRATVYKPASTFLKRGTLPIPLRTNRICRYAYCLWSFFRKIGRRRRLLHLRHNEPANRPRIPLKLACIGGRRP